MYVKAIFTAFEAFSVAVDKIYRSKTESLTVEFAVDPGSGLHWTKPTFPSL